MTDSRDVLEGPLDAAFRLLIRHGGDVSKAEDGLAGLLSGSLQNDVEQWRPADKAKLLIGYAAWQIIRTAEKLSEEGD